VDGKEKSTIEFRFLFVQAFRAGFASEFPVLQR